MRTFAELQAENRRCAFLRFLAEDPDYAMNTSLLQSALEAVGMAFPVIAWMPTPPGLRTPGWSNAKLCPVSSSPRSPGAVLTWPVAALWFPA